MWTRQAVFAAGAMGLFFTLACTSGNTAPPDSSGRIELDADRAAPGDLVDIHFPGDVDSIGAGFNLERWENERWRLKYMLWYAGARHLPTPEAELPSWEPAPPTGTVEWVLVSVGIAPGGPVTVRIPETASPGYYRICEPGYYLIGEGVPPSRETSCANIEVGPR